MNEQASASIIRECTLCGAVKDLSDFYKSKKGKIRARCKQCTRAYQSDRRARNPDIIKNIRRKEKEKYPQRVFLRRRKSHLRVNFNMTLEDYEEIHRAQGGRCDICKLTQNRVDPRSGLQQYLHVDHSHETGKIRGLLCSRCNSALGLLKEDMSIIHNLVDYIKKYKE